jgi:hypothetical protein
MSKTSKGASVSRFLTGTTGIPLLTWDYGQSEISAPPPYHIKVTTDAASWRFWKIVADLPQGISFVVRYDKYIHGVEDAVVGIRLSALAPLLEAHYNTISDRIDTFVDGG